MMFKTWLLDCVFYKKISNFAAKGDFGIFTLDLNFFHFEAFFIFSIILLLIFFVFLSNKKISNSYLNVSHILLDLLLFAVILLFLLLNNNITSPYFLFNGFYYSDFSVIFFKNLILAGFFLFIFVLKSYVAWYKRYDFEFLVVLFISLFSSMLILNSNDLLSLFFIIELQSLTFYILVSSRQVSSFSTEAGLKYFILGCFSSGIILFGISLIYGFTGFLSYSDLLLYCTTHLNNDFTVDAYFLSFTGFLAGLIFLTAGLLFKFGSVPFHMWMPDVYEGAPMIMTAYLSTVPKLALVFIFFKLYYVIFFNVFFAFQHLFLFSAILSIILGSVAAIYQVKLKRLLTYSMITNAGYLVLGISLGDISGVFATVFYLLSYVFIMLGLFFIFTSFRDRHNGLLIKKITALINLSEVHPLLSFSLFVLLFSIAGIPPLLGFYSKFFLFMFTIKMKMYLVTLIFIVFSTISVFYYIRLVKIAYFNRSLSWVFLQDISFSNSFVISGITLLNCLFFLNPNLLFKFIYNFSFYIFL